jgi:hypothetical protein
MLNNVFLSNIVRGSSPSPPQPNRSTSARVTRSKSRSVSPPATAGPSVPSTKIKLIMKPQPNVSGKRKRQQTSKMAAYTRAINESNNAIRSTPKKRRVTVSKKKNVPAATARSRPTRNRKVSQKLRNAATISNSNNNSMMFGRRKAPVASKSGRQSKPSTRFL